MSKPAKKRPSASSAAVVPASKVSQSTSADRKTDKSTSVSKQSRVITMLQSPAGATIAAMMKATDWQQHSVRGFLAGVVRKRLKLKLSSEKIEGNRVYRIVGAESSRARSGQPKRRSA